MNTYAIIVIVCYGLFVYGAGFIRPRKCSEHETPDERYKMAIRAPFMTVIGVAFQFALIWAILTLMGYNTIK